MSSASLRRSFASSDPRSPLMLSSLVTSFPQHQLITSFQTFQASPMRYSPVQSRSARAPFHDDVAPIPEPIISPRAVKRGRSSSFAKLLAPRVPPEAVPGMCPCGQNGRSIKHMVRDCPDLEAERLRLMSRNPEARSVVPQTTVEISAQPPVEQQTPKLAQIVRKRTRTLLGKVVDIPKEKEKDEKKPARTAVI